MHGDVSLQGNSQQHQRALGQLDLAGGRSVVDPFGGRRVRGPELTREHPARWWMALRGHDMGRHQWHGYALAEFRGMDGMSLLKITKAQ